jgi:hypothetical protein
MFSAVSEDVSFQQVSRMGGGWYVEIILMEFHHTALHQDKICWNEMS